MRNTISNNTGENANVEEIDEMLYFEGKNLDLKKYEKFLIGGNLWMLRLHVSLENNFRVLKLEFKDADNNIENSEFCMSGVVRENLDVLSGMLDADKTPEETESPEVERISVLEGEESVPISVNSDETIISEEKTENEIQVKSNECFISEDNGVTALTPECKTEAECEADCDVDNTSKKKNKKNKKNKK